MTDPATLQELAKRHLMMHFTSHGRYDSEDVPIISRGEGCWLWDTNGKRYFDGMSGLFCTQIGHSFGAELGEAAAKQMAELPFFINWSYAHPRVIELSAKIAELAPGDLNRTFFCSGGSEANDSIIKLVRQYHQIGGEHHRYKMIARRTRLPRHHAGRALADRDRVDQGAVRAAPARRPPRLEHERLPPPRGRDRRPSSPRSCSTSCAA